MPAIRPLRKCQEASSREKAGMPLGHRWPEREHRNGTPEHVEPFGRVAFASANQPISLTLGQTMVWRHVGAQKASALLEYSALIALLLARSGLPPSDCHQ